MFLTQNESGENFNPITDNWLVIKAINFTNSTYNDLTELVRLITNCHDELIMVECDDLSLEIIRFFDDIGKLFVFSEQHSTGKHILIVQKYLLP